MRNFLPENGQGRFVLGATALAIFLASLIPPFHVGEVTAGRDLGYSLIFMPPKYGAIEIRKLFIEYIAIFSAAILISLLSTSSRVSSILTELTIPDRLRRPLSIIVKVLAAIFLLTSYAVGKVLGVTLAIVYVPAAAFYLIGRFAMDKSKHPLLLLTSTMAAQAFLMIAGPILALTSDGQHNAFMNNTQMNNVLATLGLGLIYCGAILWFIKTVSVKSTACLFLLVGLLEYVWLSNGVQDNLSDFVAKSVLLQIVTSAFVLLLLPVSYFLYAESKHSGHSMDTEKASTGGKGPHVMNYRRLGSTYLSFSVEQFCQVSTGGTPASA